MPLFRDGIVKGSGNFFSTDATRSFLNRKPSACAAEEEATEGEESVGKGASDCTAFESEFWLLEEPG